MITGSYRDTWAEISLDRIRHNALQMKAKLHGSTRFMAVVKADGYGHGAVATARTAVKAGADWLGVAFLDEAVLLRNAGIREPILILGYTPPHAVEAAIRHGVGLTVFSDEVLDEIVACADSLGQTARVHLKIDTGMARLGVTSAKEVYRLAIKAKSSPNVLLEGIFTHFADADREDDSFTRMQFDAFTRMIDELEQQAVHFPIRHCCNSAAALRFPQMHLDLVRIGICLYGLPPDPAMRMEAGFLQPAMTLKTRISAVRPAAKGVPVSYGRTYTTPCDSLIATLPVGYADGWSRRLSNRGVVLAGGKRVPVVGRICMDQTMIDVTSSPEARVGDEVILFGQSGESEPLPVDEMAELLHTINYEMVCAVGKRVPRVYTGQHGEIRGGDGEHAGRHSTTD